MARGIGGIQSFKMEITAHIHGNRYHHCGLTAVKVFEQFDARGQTLKGHLLYSKLFTQPIP